MERGGGRGEIKEKVAKEDRTIRGRKGWIQHGKEGRGGGRE